MMLEDCSRLSQRTNLHVLGAWDKLYMHRPLNTYLINILYVIIIFILLNQFINNLKIYNLNIIK